MPKIFLLFGPSSKNVGKREDHCIEHLVLCLVVRRSRCYGCEGRSPHLWSHSGITPRSRDFVF